VILVKRQDACQFKKSLNSVIDKQTETAGVPLRDASPAKLEQPVSIRSGFKTKKPLPV
jgi:hypothetical protein